MVNDDQNPNIDEFDNLIEDDAAFQDETFPQDIPYKKKSKAGFYLILLIMIAAAGGAAWYLFLRPSVDSVTNTPQASATQDASGIAQQQLPPGISVADADAESEPQATPSYEMARQEIAGISDEEDQQLAADGTLLDEGQVPAEATDENPVAEAPLAPEAEPVEPSASTGMTAEALPPPVALSLDDTLPPADEENTAELAADDAALQQPETPLETSEAAQDDAQEQSDSAPASVTAEQDAVQLQAQAPVPDITQEPAPSVVPAAPIVTETASAPSADEANAVSDRLNQVEQQLRALSADVAVTQTNVQQLARTPDTQQPAQIADTSSLEKELRNLSARLETLAQQVESLDQRTTTLATELQNQDSSAAPAPAARTIQPKAAQPAIKAEEPKPAAVKAEPKPAAQPATKPATAPKPAASSAVSGWELRSAQPGVAWLGRKGSSEMTRHTVGSTVPGLGTIRSVRQENGRWIVEGSQGTLRQ